MGKPLMEMINRQYTIKRNKIKVTEILNDASSELKECLWDKVAV